MASYCIPKVQEIGEEFKGLADEGLAPRKFYSAADGSTVKQLTLFEAKPEYDLD